MNELERRDLDAWAERTRAQSAALHDGARLIRALRDDHRLAACERVERRIAEEHRLARCESSRAAIL